MLGDSKRMNLKSNRVTPTIPIFGVISVILPFLGYFTAISVSSRRHGYESGEASMIHYYQFCGVLMIGFTVAGLFALIACIRRERYCWFTLAGLVLDYLIIRLLFL